VFTRNGSNWIETAKLTASDGSVEDMLGNAVAISDGIIAVGASWADGFAVNNQGFVYLFPMPKPSWTYMSEKAKVVAPDGAANDIFGCSIALTETLLVSGAFWADGPAGVDQGSAYVFQIDRSAVPTLSHYGLAAATVLIVCVGAVLFRHLRFTASVAMPQPSYDAHES
jgi:hypothetical protein